jgi:DNA-binding transcriptional MocR family regulator
LATCCQEGLLEPHIEGLRQIYRQRRDAMLVALEAHMPPGVAWTMPLGGFFVWLTLPPPLLAVETRRFAREAGVWVLAGHPFFAEEPTGQHLRLAYSYVSPDGIDTGIQALAGVLKHR